MRAPDAPDPASQIRESVPAQPAPPKVTITAPRPVAEQPDEPDVKAPPAVVPEAPVPPRPVAPSIIAIPPVDSMALERVEARPPLSEIAQAVPPKKPPPKPLLFQPVAEAAGIIVAGGRTITISGTEPIPDGEMCGRQIGGTWPCGRAARSAFRAFLRGRAVTCDFPEGEVPDQLTTSCRLGPRDIGAWLVENDWARAAGDAYAKQAKAAEDAARGLFGNGPASLPAAPSGLNVAPSPASSGGEAGPADISILPSGSEPRAPDSAAGSSPTPSIGQDDAIGDALPPPVSPPARPALQ